MPPLHFPCRPTAVTPAHLTHLFLGLGEGSQVEQMTTPSSFDEMSNQLWDGELRELQDLWATYNYLYVEDPGRVTKLRQPRWGGFFWDLVQRSTVSGIILSVSRLTDPPEMGKRRNLTLKALLDDPRLPGQLRHKLGRELKRIRKSVEKIRKYRHRVVAHKDERTALGQDALPTLHVGQIEEIISRLQDVHRKHRGAAMSSDVLDYGTYTHGNVENLVKRLGQAERASRIFVERNRSDEGKLRDWDRARRVLLGF